MTEEQPFVGHILDDDEFCQYMLLKDMARKILLAQNNGQLGLIVERQRLMGQLEEIMK